MSAPCGIQSEQTESIEECVIEEYEEGSEELYDAGKSVQNQIYKSLLFLIVSKINGESKETYNSEDIQCRNTIEFINGNKYKGNLDENFRIHGKGEFFWNDGSHYKGQFRNNRLHGKGKLTTIKKDDYTGIFNYGVCHGECRYQSRELFYLGDFLNGKFHGQGLLETPSLTYEKDYPPPIERVPVCKLGIKEKPLTKQKILKAPSQFFEGEFSDDSMKKGVRKYLNGIFAGDFDRYGYRMYGKFKFKNGDKYFGSFAEDLCCDFGIYEWNYEIEPDNSMIKFNEQYFYGFWSNGKRNGFGLVKFDERTLFCIWDDHKKQGPGVMVAANGEVFVSTVMFDNNKYKEGWKLKINPITISLMNILFNFKEKRSVKEPAVLKGTNFGFCFSNEDYFKAIVNKLMNHILYKSQIFPMFIPNFALHIDLPCLFDVVRLILENNNNNNYPKNQKIKSFCLTTLNVDECCVPDDYVPPKRTECTLNDISVTDFQVEKSEDNYHRFVSKTFLPNSNSNHKFPYYSQFKKISPVSSYESFSHYPVNNNVRKVLYSKHLKTDIEIREELLKKYVPPDDNFAKMKRIYPNEILSSEKVALLSARQLLEKELKSLNQVIFENLSKLQELYLRYSTFNVDNLIDKTTDQICMQRIGLWLFYKDVFQVNNFPKISIQQVLSSFYDLYKIFTKDHLNPFDSVYFYEFLRHFLHIVFTLNANVIIRDYAIKESTSMYGLFSTMVLIFFREFHQTIEPFSGTLYFKKMIENTPNLTRDLLKIIYDFDCSADIDIRTVYKFYKHIQIENGNYFQNVCIKSAPDENNLNLINYSRVINNFFLDNDAQIQYKNGLFLNCINDKNFMDCSKIMFPKLTQLDYIMLSELQVNILEFFDLVLLLFDQETANRDLLKKITHISFLVN